MCVCVRAMCLCRCVCPSQFVNVILQDVLVHHPGDDFSDCGRRKGGRPIDQVGWPHYHRRQWEANGLEFPKTWKSVCGLGPRESNIVHFFMQTMPPNETVVLDVSQDWRRLPTAFKGEVPTLTGVPYFCCDRCNECF